MERFGVATREELRPETRFRPGDAHAASLAPPARPAGRAAAHRHELDPGGRCARKDAVSQRRGLRGGPAAPGPRDAPPPGPSHARAGPTSPPPVADAPPLPPPPPRPELPLPP